MSNPTTPFSWQMPTSTDLVTDLPADFEVFGQAVATSMADLLGGTTGQVLAKTTSTDMDFTWTTPQVGDITGVTAGVGITGGGTSGTVTVTNDMATTITTNGDLLYGTGSGTYTRRAIGSTGNVLTVAGGIPTWAAPAASSSGLVFLDRQTFSAVSSYSLTSKFSATYDNYRIMLRITALTSSGRVDTRLRSSTTDNTSSNYRSARVYQLGTSVTGAGDTTGTATSFFYNLERDTQSAFLSMDLYSPFQTEYTSYTGQSSYYYAAYGQHNQVDAGQMSVTTSYDGITFFPPTGTMTGEIYLYGYARS
jgi:hypothetical protein